MTDSPILCFQHCHSGTNTYCVSMPSVCPECSLPLLKSTFKIPPFRPPGPFVGSRQSPYSVVLKPTVGTFLVDYINGCNLHVGVTDSFGITYDFDSHGVNRSFHGWSQVLAVELTDYLDEDKSALWNSKLHEFTGYECWLPERYSEDSFNCYDFVLEFLRLMGLQETLPCIATKLDFCREMVLPQTTRAAKYIWLYRRILQEGPVISSDTAT